MSVFFYLKLTILRSKIISLTCIQTMLTTVIMAATEIFLLTYSKSLEEKTKHSVYFILTFFRAHNITSLPVLKPAVDIFSS